MFIAKKGFRLTVLIIAIIGIIIGVVYALDFLGIINFSQIASKVPVVGQYFSNDKTKGKTNQNKSDEKVKELMEANQKLAKSNDDLKNNITNLNGKLSKITAEKNDLEKKYQDEITKNKTEDQTNLDDKKLEDEKYRKLAKYYSSMKPDAVVKIMNQLDDYLVIEILNRVDPDQTAKILSKMDPKKAADLSKQMVN